MGNIDDHMTKLELQKKLKLHRNTVSRMLARGLFPNAFRTEGGRWRIPVRDVEKYINSGKRGGKA